MSGHRMHDALIASAWMVVVAVVTMLSGCTPADQTEPAQSLPAAQTAVEDVAVPAVVPPELSSVEEWARDKVRLRDAALQELLGHGAATARRRAGHGLRIIGPDSDGRQTVRTS